MVELLLNLLVCQWPMCFCFASWLAQSIVYYCRVVVWFQLYGHSKYLNVSCNTKHSLGNWNGDFKTGRRDLAGERGMWTSRREQNQVSSLTELGFTLFSIDSWVVRSTNRWHGTWCRGYWVRGPRSKVTGMTAGGEDRAWWGPLSLPSLPKWRHPSLSVLHKQIS